MEIIVPIGISGSGKSRLYRKKYSNLPIVSPDMIRKEITGDISDQSKNNDVFVEVDKKIDELVDRGESFFYDATNVNTKYRKDFVNKFIGKDVKIIYVILPCDISLSYMRIMCDIENNVERSNVPLNAIKKQAELYKQSLESGFEGENVQEIIYIKNEDLQ